jgi:hypothetical protein
MLCRLDALTRREFSRPSSQLSCRLVKKLYNLAGLPDFSWNLIPKPEKMYQTNTECTKRSQNNPNARKIVQMSIKYVNIFQSKYFLFENKPSGKSVTYETCTTSFDIFLEPKNKKNNHDRLCNCNIKLL